jgi:TM2 domain-containing membrane protein YozV
MFAVIAGIVLALVFLGLPLGIIALFILSIVDQRSTRAGRWRRTSTTIRQDNVVRYPEQKPERTTAKRREQMIVWRNPEVKRYISAR